MRTLIILTGLCILLSWSSESEAVSAASCSNGDIQTAINAAVDGETVTVPAGSCTWTGGVTTPDTKGLLIQGAGAGSTVISLAGFRIISTTSSARQPHRITGFTFKNTASCSGLGDSLQILGTAQNWRIDHNTFDGNVVNLCYPIRIGDANENTDNFTYGLIDHNSFINANNNTSIFIEWDRGSPNDPVASGDYIWSQTAERGTAQAVYIEDNTFSEDLASFVTQKIDCRWGCKYVFRYNTVHNPWISTHSGCTNTGRNPVWQEIYNNTLTDDTGNYTGSTIEMRATSGVIFKNSFAVAANKFLISDDHERSYTTCSGPYGGRADGTRAWDENTVGQSGWRALGQPGWGPPQATNMSAYTFAGVFAWENLNNGTRVDMSIANNNPFTSTHIVFGREMYNQPNITFGTLAARPATCANSDLVGRDIYIATDQNDFGVKMYQCSAPNVWTFHYEPYTYPHPLQGIVASGPRRFSPRQYIRKIALDEALLPVRVPDYLHLIDW